MRYFLYVHVTYSIFICSFIFLQAKEYYCKHRNSESQYLIFRDPDVQAERPDVMYVFRWPSRLDLEILSRLTSRIKIITQGVALSARWEIPA
jgi:hypothetical protein